MNKKAQGLIEYMIIGSLIILVYFTAVFPTIIMETQKQHQSNAVQEEILETESLWE